MQNIYFWMAYFGLKQNCLLRWEASDYELLYYDYIYVQIYTGDKSIKI